jgi:Tfp pilus assembly protein PilN
MKLRTNLATRPFYNVRAVQVMLGLLAVTVLFFTVFNVTRVIQLTGSQSTLGARASSAEADAERLRTEAARIRTQINQKELEAVAAAAREANGIIDRRAFSWTDLFTQLEATLPDDVRITNVQPRVEKGVIKIGLIAESRRPEDLAAFIEALEESGTFRNVVPLQQHADDQGLIQLALEGDYSGPLKPAGDATAAAAKPSSAKQGVARD